MMRMARAAAAAGLRGVAFEAGGTLLTDRAACVAEADAAGLFLIGIDIGLDLGLPPAGLAPDMSAVTTGRTTQ